MEKSGRGGSPFGVFAELLRCNRGFIRHTPGFTAFVIGQKLRADVIEFRFQRLF